MSDKKVLLTDATSYKAVVSAKFIKKVYPDVEVYTCDTRPLSRFFRTKFTDNHILLKSTISQPDKYREEIANIIKKFEIDVLFPVNSKEMEIFISQKELFGTALSYCGNYEPFRNLNEKDKLKKLCEKCNIRIPKFFNKDSDITLPVVIKPKVSSSSKGVRYFYNAKKLNSYLKNLTENLIIQEYIEGDGMGYSVFAADGKIKTGYGHKRIAEYPITGGSSMYRESFEDNRMIDIASLLLRETKWSGFAMFEFKLTAQNELYLIEVNPRIWGSINQGLQNGANYFCTLLGEKEIVHNKKMKMTYFSPFVYLSFLCYIMRGNFYPFVEFVKSIPVNKADINIFDDPRGWFGSLLRLI